MIRILYDDIDVFVLLVYRVYQAELQCQVQMERWDVIAQGDQSPPELIEVIRCQCK